MNGKWMKGDQEELGKKEEKGRKQETVGEVQTEPLL